MAGGYFAGHKIRLFKSKKKILFDNDSDTKLYGKDCVFDGVSTPRSSEGKTVKITLKEP